MICQIEDKIMGQTSGSAIVLFPKIRELILDLRVYILWRISVR